MLSGLVASRSLVQRAFSSGYPRLSPVLRAVAHASCTSDILRERIAPGRSRYVNYNGLVWTVAIPAGKTGGETVAEQTKLTLADLDTRLAAAGTNKSRILDATVFLSDITTKDEMDRIWVEWVPEGCEPSRIILGAHLAHGFLVEVKVTAALPETKMQ
mmetsp:Transcript_76362/g.151026  ORF Transcript_76362/g.151026 Transcript_76362/m.151026 type:complete len:158 (-) Transcript_76362:27-500(-)